MDKTTHGIRLQQWLKSYRLGLAAVRISENGAARIACLRNSFSTGSVKLGNTAVHRTASLMM